MSTMWVLFVFLAWGVSTELVSGLAARDVGLGLTTQKGRANCLSHKASPALPA